MTEPQVIRDKKANPVFAVIPWREYQHLKLGSAEVSPTEQELYEEAKSSTEEVFPVEIVDRLLAGDNPIKVYRKLRGMTQQQLAVTVDVNAVYLSHIETGKRTGSLKILAAIAYVLNVDLEDLRP